MKCHFHVLEYIPSEIHVSYGRSFLTFWCLLCFSIGVELDDIPTNYSWEFNFPHIPTAVVVSTLFYVCHCWGALPWWQMMKNTFPYALCLFLCLLWENICSISLFTLDKSICACKHYVYMNKFCQCFIYFCILVPYQQVAHTYFQDQVTVYINWYKYNIYYYSFIKKMINSYNVLLHGCS